MARRLKSKYESEIHLGFLAIAFLLVALNFVSNYVLNQARLNQSEETRTQLRRAAMIVTRELKNHPLQPQDRASLVEIRDRNGLADLALLPARPKDSDAAGRRDWLAAAARHYPAADYPALPQRLLGAEPGELVRGEGPSYYAVQTLSTGTHGGLLVLALRCPELAYLEDSGRMLMAVLVGALLAVAAVYALLSRFMFRPFRRIRAHAELAGRAVTSAEDETEAVVEEYERVIGELTHTQAELLRLNEEIRHRADALELINRSLTETSRLGVVTLDMNGRVVAANETAGRLLRCSPGAGPGTSLEQLLARFDRLASDVRRAYTDERARGYHEYVDPTDRRGEAVVGATITEIRDPERGMTGLLLMFSDQSELIRLRKELENRQRLAALGEMAGGLAHQIRNSLGAISGYAALAKKRLRQAAIPSEGVESLLDETRLANDLIDRFLTFARPLDLRLERTDLAALVKGCIESVRVRQDLHGVVFRESLDAGAVAEVDPLLLKQVVANLLDNAVNACGDSGGLVEVALRRGDDGVVLDIRDNGCGIAPDVRDKIFTPFYSSRPSGTGLGLSLAARIVALHHGSITVQSEPGQGACFSLVLPRASATPSSRPASEIPTPA